MNTLHPFQIDSLIIQALEEDMVYGDLATQAVYQTGQRATVQLLGRQSGIIAGMAVFSRTFQLLEEGVEIQAFVQDGDVIEDQLVLAEVTGQVSTLLSGERTALNFLQRMSGIATATHDLVQILEGTGIKLQDTRKTNPGHRLLDKYAVRVGGGYNHRFSLSDQLMLKDNHIRAAGGVKEAIQMAKTLNPYTHKIEVEVEDLDMVKEAVEAGADIIMLDNMSVEQIKEALQIIDGSAIVEVSGNVSASNIENYRGLGIDYISSGAITHSAGILDLSMKNLTIL